MISVGLAVFKTFPKSKKLKSFFIVIFLFIISVNFLAVQKYFKRFNQERNVYAHSFFKRLKELLPAIPSNSLLYFQPKDDPHIRFRLSDMYRVGYYGTEATFAVFYNLKKEEVKETIEFEEAVSFVKENPKNINKVFAFAYDENGLSDITSQVRKSLKGALEK